MEQFLKDWGTLLLAIYGVIQVWLIAIWKRYFKKGTVTVYKTGKLEVGHSNFGPTLTVAGTLLSTNKDVFISEIYLKAKRLKDDALQEFEWLAFRPQQFHLKKSDQVTLELPSAFIVKPDSPHHFNIFFSGSQIRKEFEPFLIDLQQDWSQYLSNKRNDIEKLSSELKITQQSVVEDLYNNDFFKNSEPSQKAWDIIRNKVFWEPGKFSVTLHVKTNKENISFQDKWSFSIDEQQHERFRLNSIAVINEMCVGHVNYNFAYVDYEKAL